MNDRQPTELDYFWAALMFYTRIPVPNRALHSQHILNASRKYFPLIGLIIGLIAGTTFLFANLVFDAPLSIALSMVATILATGAFHEDGFADSCDGFGGGWTRDQVLLIMKDSRVGSYATVGLVLLLGTKFLALLEVSISKNSLLIVAIYIGAHTLSRTLSSSMIDVFDYVQDIDASKVKPITEQHLSPTDKLISIGITIGPIALLLVLAPAATLLAVLASSAVALGFMGYSRHRIGGYTGDVLGATQQLSELTFYLSFAAAL